MYEDGLASGTRGRNEGVTSSVMEINTAGGILGVAMLQGPRQHIYLMVLGIDLGIRLDRM